MSEHPDVLHYGGGPDATKVYLWYDEQGEFMDLSYEDKDAKSWSGNGNTVFVFRLVDIWVNV